MLPRHSTRPRFQELRVSLDAAKSSWLDQQQRASRHHRGRALFSACHGHSIVRMSSLKEGSQSVTMLCPVSAASMHLMVFPTLLDQTDFNIQWRDLNSTYLVFILNSVQYVL